MAQGEQDNSKGVATVENLPVAAQKFTLVPKDLTEAMQFAKMMADSEMVPKDFKGKPANVVVAVQMGLEIGLSPMQAIQSIAIINGRPSVWGDAMLAVVQNHQAYEWHKESIKSGEAATFTIKRHGSEPHTVVFTKEMAKQAGLWGKIGPWQSYPDRMLQMRARSWGLRDQFSDALRGLPSAEEMRDIVETTATITPEPFKQPKQKATEPPQTNKKADLSLDKQENVAVPEKQEGAPKTQPASFGDVQHDYKQGQIKVAEVLKSKRLDGTPYFKIIAWETGVIFFTQNESIAAEARKLKGTDGVILFGYDTLGDKAGWIIEPIQIIPPTPQPITEDELPAA